MFEDLLLTRFTIMPCVPEQWGPEILKLEGHYEAVNAVVFSTDHTRLGSVSDDQTVRI